MFQSTLRTRFAILAVVGILALTARAEIPLYISHQGKVTDTYGQAVADGYYTMRFRIDAAASGRAMPWVRGTRSFAAEGIDQTLLGMEAEHMEVSIEAV